MSLMGQAGPPRDEVERAIADLLQFRAIQMRVKLGKTKPMGRKAARLAYGIALRNLQAQPEDMLWAVLGELAGPVLIEMVNEEIERGAG